MKYNKLVRNEIPRIIKEKGQTPTCRIAIPGERRNYAVEKLWEEVREYADAKTKEGKLGELADILEVLRLLCKVDKIFFKEVDNARKKKAKKRGTFSEWVILEQVV